MFFDEKHSIKFQTMPATTLNQVYNDLKKQLQEAGSDNSTYESRYILEECANLTWSDIITAPEKTLSNEQLKAIEAVITKRAGGMPLPRIFGEAEFWGLKFKLNEATLQPRPETEILVEKALCHIKTYKNASVRILDLGTGTGCIPISLLKECANASAMAVDLEEKALIAASQNAKNNNVDSRFEVIETNWFENVSGKFDLITSNPPYIDSSDIANLDSNVTSYDPILALDGGEKGLNPYEVIFSQIKNYMNTGAKAYFEIGAGQCGYIQGIAEKYGIRICDIHPDYAGIPRVVEISCGDKS